VTVGQQLGGEDGEGAAVLLREGLDRVERFVDEAAVEESKMLGGASQIVSTIRVTCNGK
jgi:hypothetical protein